MAVDPGRRSLVRKLRVAAVAAAALVALLVVTGIGERESGGARLRDWTEAQAVPTVALVSLNPQPGFASLDLPGRLEAATQAPIYARVSGYVKTRNVDIGDAVKAGQTLAEIEAPDLDQQLLQAKADLASAEASARLSQVTLERGRSLLNSAAVSQQDLDQRAADLGVKQAAVRAAQANVERLQALAGYERLAAPFNGVVTARNTDVGALINAGSSAAAPMFVVSDLRRLRVYINVPQNYAPSIRIGATAAVSAPEYPGRAFAATVEASARSVDPASGATLMQLGVDNADGALMPGAYASVHFELAGAPGVFRLPVAALVFDRRGLRVATVDAQNHVAFKTVTIARDLGAEIEIGSGLAAGDRVIASPADGLADGDEVRVVEPQHKS
jgi:RND family efflux transporter MFP subunit